MFSENTEVRDGIAQLTARAVTPDVAQALIREMAWYDAYLERGNVRPQRQHLARQQEGRPVEHRRKGHGLDRRNPGGRRYRRRGARPAEKLAARGAGVHRHAGQRLHLRHAATGRRHEPACLHHGPRARPYGLAQVPVIKVATRTGPGAAAGMT